MTVVVKDYTGLTPAWCPGCGNFGILTALRKALVDLNLEPHQVLLVSDIGQAGKLPHYAGGNVFNSLHGRAIPPALGAKIANRDLNVIVISGDGGAYGEGANHFIHTARRNHDVTYLVHDNQVYGLTKGQTAPTSEEGFVTKTTPGGAPQPVNPLLLALAVGASFVARGFAGDTGHLVELIKEGVRHRGFALIDILQPCVSFDRKHTFAYYRDHVYKLDPAAYNVKDRNQAFLRVQEWEARIPLGVFYKEERPTYEDTCEALRLGRLVEQPVDPMAAQELFKEFL